MDENRGCKFSAEDTEITRMIDADVSKKTTRTHLVRTATSPSLLIAQAATNSSEEFNKTLLEIRESNSNVVPAAGLKDTSERTPTKMISFAEQHKRVREKGNAQMDTIEEKSGMTSSSYGLATKPETSEQEYTDTVIQPRPFETTAILYRSEDDDSAIATASR